MKVLVIGATQESLSNFRGNLIRAMVSLGNEVTAMASDSAEGARSTIESLGVDFLPFPISRCGLNPVQDVKTMIALRRVYSQLQPDIVLAYTSKPVIWGGIALRGLRNSTKFYALITGLGYAFRSRTMNQSMLNRLVTVLYRLALSRAEAVIFQNRDDLGVFSEMGIVAHRKCALVNGSGIDLESFPVAPFPEKGIEFLCISRLIGQKGLREYVEAAKKVKKYYPQAVFRLLGGEDPSPDGISIAEVSMWQRNGLIEYGGEVEDVRPYLAACHVFVLPSFYREGLPRSILEAMATGRPILTTDNVGCRETVKKGINGCLVPVRDSELLAERMIWFIEHRDQINVMGEMSRSMAEEHFDVHKVNKEMLHIMKINTNKSEQ